MDIRSPPRWLVLVAVGLAIGGLALAPLGDVIDTARVAAPWVVVGLLVSEGLFIAGLGTMIVATGSRLPSNPFRWRAQLLDALKGALHTKVFWLGFWVNLVGAVGTAVIGAAAVFIVLPPLGYGLLIVPALDLFATVVIRSAVVSLDKGPS